MLIYFCNKLNDKGLKFSLDMSYFNIFKNWVKME